MVANTGPDLPRRVGQARSRGPHDTLFAVVVLLGFARRMLVPRELRELPTDVKILAGCSGDMDYETMGSEGHAFMRRATTKPHPSLAGLARPVS